MSRLDRLSLTGLHAFAHHGVFEHERRDGQPFIVDLTAHLDLSPAGAGDDLADTIHYGELAEQVVAAVERDPVDLIETLAERIAELVLGYPAARAVEVTVHKPEAPIAVPFADVSVTLHRAWTRAIIALGANLGDREASLRGALAGLGAHRRIRTLGASPIVETPALRTDGVDETAPAYLNAVAALETTLPPLALLAELQRVEQEHGRTREVRWGDRTLDLDLITYGEERLAGPTLVVPHPRAHERAFVLAPWVQLDPHAEVPGRGPVRDLLERVLAATGERVDPYPAEPLL